MLDRQLVGIVMPVWIQNDALLQQTIECVKRIEFGHLVKLYVATTRLHGHSPDELHGILSEAGLETRVFHKPNVSLSVAAAWNVGCRAAIADGCEFLLILANDVLLEPDTIDKL